jgi:protein SCO1/2
MTVFPRTLSRHFVRDAFRSLTLASACSLALVLAACGSKSPVFENLDIAGNTSFARDFSLPDTNAIPRSLADYNGKIVVLAFGYTHCPDVCPTTLAELSQTLDALGPEAASRVQVLFVTVDPQRDTANVLAQYVTAFNPSFRALRPASESQLERVAQSFKITYEKVPGKTADSYTMTHTAACYVFDSNGKIRLFVPDGQGVSPWLHDLKVLLSPGGSA